LEKCDWIAVPPWSLQTSCKRTTVPTNKKRGQRRSQAGQLARDAKGKDFAAHEDEQESWRYQNTISESIWALCALIDLDQI
jgi:hypothetical protein